MDVTKLSDLDVSGKRVLMRVDFNVPIKEGKVASDKRIQAALPGIKEIISKGAHLALISHLGRPKEGEYNREYSLQPVADHLSELLGQSVPLITDWVDGFDLTQHAVVMCENVRFNVGEKANDEALAKKMADQCDLFVMDAFGTAHRAQASTHGVAQQAGVAAAGPLLIAELDALAQALKAPKPPMVAIVGGAKVSTKLTVLRNLLDKVGQLIVGGGIANTFLAAAGHAVGKSLYEPDLVSEAKALLDSGKVPLPVDVVVATEFSADQPGVVKRVDDVAADEMILDVGPRTVDMFAAMLSDAGTIVWNGPVGVFEMAPFANGTKGVSEAVASSDAFSIAGGGDTLAAIDQFGIADDVSYISTGGGAFLEFLEGKVLPAVEVLEKSAQPAE